MEKKESKLYVGTSGYSYKDWGDGVFYPEGLTPDKWLEYYTGYFNTVELNVSFYRLPFKGMFKSWFKRTPENFIFAIKGSRYISHIKRLEDCLEPLKRLIDRAELLGEKLGIVLWQLPPRFNVDYERFEQFVELLNRNFKGRSVFEFRDNSWLDKKIFTTMEKNNMALCFSDLPKLKVNEPVTANFIYIRRHGPEKLYSSSYSEKEIKEESQKIKKWLKEGMDVYIYFNNDGFGYAIENALTLKRFLKDI